MRELEEGELTSNKVAERFHVINISNVDVEQGISTSGYKNALVLSLLEVVA